MEKVFQAAAQTQEGLEQLHQFSWYRECTSTLRWMNTDNSGYENVNKPGYPRQCYMLMPPMPFMPVLPDGVYPVDYDDLSTLSEERADLIMASYNLNGPDNENVKLDIMDKIWIISTFMGAVMKDEFRDDYSKKQVVKELKKRAADKMEVTK